jgi:hypothetical protein
MKTIFSIKTFGYNTITEETLTTYVECVQYHIKSPYFEVLERPKHKFHVCVND